LADSDTPFLYTRDTNPSVRLNINTEYLAVFVRFGAGTQTQC